MQAADQSDQSELPKLEQREPWRLLVVEDDPAAAKTVVRTFRDDYVARVAKDAEEGLAIAREFTPNVVICDLRLPQMSGLDLLATLQEEQPLSVRILITAYSDYQRVVDALNDGRVHHYFEKPFHPLNIRKAVESLLRSQQLEAERVALIMRLQMYVRQLQEKESELEGLVAKRTAELEEANRGLQSANNLLRELAVQDELTGLFNRRYLFDELEQEAARSARYRRPLTVVFFDVDDFKSINDSYGHAAGDAVLKGIADILKAPGGLRIADIAARYGGEEFCVLLPETEIAGAKTTAERLLAAVSSRDWSGFLPPERRVTISAGVAACPEHGVTADTLLKAADGALYTAKRSGKNRVVIAPIA